MSESNQNSVALTVVFPHLQRLGPVIQWVLSQYAGVDAFPGQKTGPMTRVVYELNVRLVLASFEQEVGAAVQWDLETPLFSFGVDDHRVHAHDLADRIQQVDPELTPFIDGGPEPVTDKMSIVSISEMPGIRFAFHDLDMPATE
jgi:hypothetical protein